VCVGFVCKEGKLENLERCTENSHCNSGACYKGRCRAKGEAKGSCRENDHCVSGVCVSTKCKSGPVDGGEKCNDDDDWYVPDGDVAVQQCRRYSVLTELPLSSSSSRANSDNGLVCVPRTEQSSVNGKTDMVCRTDNRSEGQLCKLNSHCASEVCIKKKCKAQASAAGGTCDKGDDDDCRSGYV